MLYDLEPVERENREPMYCSLCLDDETVDEEAKKKDSRTTSTPESHITSKMHAPIEKSRPRCQQNLDINTTTGWRCPYCDELGVLTVFKLMNKLIDHLRYNTTLPPGQEEHRQALAEVDGWGLPGFDWEGPA